VADATKANATGHDANNSPATPEVSPSELTAAEQNAQADTANLKARRVGEIAQLVVLGLGPLAFSCFYFWQVISLPTLNRPLPVSPRAWPLITAIAMIIVSAVISMTIATGRLRARADEESESLAIRDVLSTVAALAIVIVAFERVGFLLTSTLLVAGLSTLISPSRWKRNIVVAVSFAVVAELLFESVFGVHLPAGILTLPTLR
jgi:putative tricarboxylic transport membrane protein